MTALPDTIMPERALAPVPQITLPDTHGAVPALVGTARRFVGSALVLTAVGIWLFPVAPGDVGLQFIKLSFSLALLAGAVISLISAPRRAGPHIEIDREKRQISLTDFDAKGRVRAEIVHDFDTLGEVVLRDKWFTARDTNGRQLVSLPIHDAKAESALRDMFSPA